MDEFNNVFGIDIGEYWQPTADGGLQCPLFRLPDAPAKEPRVREYFDETILTIQDSLIGKTWRTQRAQRLDDIKNNRGFEQAEEAETLGLNIGLAFPVTNKTADQRLGVISPFSRKRLPDDPELLEMLEKIGRDLGEFKRRLLAERALAEEAGLRWPANLAKAALSV